MFIHISDEYKFLKFKKRVFHFQLYWVHTYIATIQIVLNDMIYHQHKNKNIKSCGFPHIYAFLFMLHVKGGEKAHPLYLHHSVTVAHAFMLIE